MAKKPYKIQVKRSDLSISDSKIQDAELYYGEPLYLNQPGYLIIGKKPVSSNETTSVPDNKVLRVVPRKATVNEDGSPVQYDVADNPVFYRNRDTDNDNSAVNLMDENGYILYPRTLASEVTDDNHAVNIAQMLANKVETDAGSNVRFLAMGYDNTKGAVYFTEFTVDSSQLSDNVLAMINSRVAIDADSYYQSISVGYSSLEQSMYVNMQ